MARDIYLELENVSKTFPGVKALSDVCFSIRKGEIHGLIGENGAGKSTLIKILTGVYQPDPGAIIRIEDEEVKFNGPIDSLRKGIGVIHQDLALFQNLTVSENIAISQEIERGSKCINWKKMRRVASNSLEKLQADLDLDTRVGNLSIAKQQMVAISRSIANDTKMVIMDEPTSALSGGEVENLFRVMNRLKESGITVVFVSHKLDELFAVCNRFTVLRDGMSVGTFDKEELNHEKLISHMVGRQLNIDQFKKRKRSKPLLTVKEFNKKGNFKDISFTLHEGEILGITGLVGSGRTELIQAICGIHRADSGELWIQGVKTVIRSTKDAVKHGIGYVPESRQREGLVLKQSVEHNLTMTTLRKLTNRLGIISEKKKQELADRWIQVQDIRPAIKEMEVEKLSGGNQQKVVIAKWLATQPKVLIIDEPTNGIDVVAKSGIHKQLRELASSGMGILMISSELPEVLAVSDRILVMRTGRFVAEFDGENTTQEEIITKAISTAQI